MTTHKYRQQSTQTHYQHTGKGKRKSKKETEENIHTSPAILALFLFFLSKLAPLSSFHLSIHTHPFVFSRAFILSSPLCVVSAVVATSFFMPHTYTHSTQERRSTSYTFSLSHTTCADMHSLIPSPHYPSVISFSSSININK